MKKTPLLLSIILMVSCCFGQDPKAAEQYQEMMKQMMASMSNVKMNAVYSFPVYMKNHLITYENGKVKEEMDLEYYVNSDTKTFATSGSMMGNASKKSKGDMISVFDNQNSAMLIFNRSNNTLFAMNLDAFKNMGSMMGGAAQPSKEHKKDAADFKCGKTGKTKTIMGYSCYEFACTSTDSKSRSSFWLSNDLKVGDVNYLDAIIPFVNYNRLGFTGAILGMDAYDEDGQLATSMIVTEIDKSADIKLVTADFKQQQMPSFN